MTPARRRLIIKTCNTTCIPNETCELLRNAENFSEPGPVVQYSVRHICARSVRPCNRRESRSVYHCIGCDALGSPLYATIHLVRTQLCNSTSFHGRQARSTSRGSSQGERQFMHGSCRLSMIGPHLHMHPSILQYIISIGCSNARN